MREFSQADQVLREAAEAGAVPGVVAMAATRDGPVYQGAFGKRVLPSGAAMTVDTLFWIASMTKAITSTAAMQLVERGKLALDRPIRDVLPQLAAAKVLEGFDSAGEPKLRPAGRDITLRHLLTHTAGFAYDIWSPDLIRYQEKKGIPGVISCQNVALTTPLLFDPGERWNYGINIDWVGKAVEKVSGQKLDAYFRDNIFGPLGMRDTGFKLDASRRARLSGMHVRLLETAMPPYSNDAEFFPGMVKKWGLGFMINTERVPGRRGAGSLAWAGLGNTYFWIDPDEGVAGVILAQLIPFADPKVLALFEQFETAVYAALH